MVTEYKVFNLNGNHKSRELPRWKVVISWLLIFMVTEVYKLVPSFAFASLYFNIFLFAGWFAFFLYILKYGINSICWWIIGYCLLFPVYGSLKAEHLFGQSFLLGVASLRYLSFILCGYILLLIKYPYSNIIRQINTFNLWVAGLSIVMILILNIPAHTLNGLFVDTNFVEYDGSSSEGYQSVRGSRFTKCSQIIFVSLVYYLLDIMRNGFNKKNIPRFLLLLIYMLFVHKGRQPVAVLGIVYIIAYIRMRGLTLKKFLLTLLPVITVCIIVIAFPEVLQSFTTILEGDKSQDFSTLARIWSVESISPYIESNPILGVGNLSPHYKNGFHGILGRTFYIADIGIIGTMARGGIVLIFIYLGLYLTLLINIGRIHNFVNKQFLGYMLLVHVCLLIIFFNDILYGDGAVGFALIFYPLFTNTSTLRKLGVCRKSI